MRTVAQWFLRHAALAAFAFAIAALNGCASTDADGATEPTQEKWHDRRDDPFYTPFSA